MVNHAVDQKRHGKLLHGRIRGVERDKRFPEKIKKCRAAGGNEYAALQCPERDFFGFRRKARAEALRHQDAYRNPE